MSMYNYLSKRTYIRTEMQYLSGPVGFTAKLIIRVLLWTQTLLIGQTFLSWYLENIWEPKLKLHQLRRPNDVRAFTNGPISHRPREIIFRYQWLVSQDNYQLIGLT